MRTCHSCACTIGTLLRLTSAPTTFTAVLPMIAKQRSLCFERTAYEKRCLDFSRFEQLITMTRCCGSVCDSLGTHTYRRRPILSNWLDSKVCVPVFILSLEPSGQAPFKGTLSRPARGKFYTPELWICGTQLRDWQKNLRRRTTTCQQSSAACLPPITHLRKRYTQKGTTRVSSMLRHAPRKTSSTHNRLPSLKTTMSRSRTNYK